MPTEQPEGNIRDLKDFKDIQRACCKKDPPQPGGPQGAGGLCFGSQSEVFAKQRRNSAFPETDWSKQSLIRFTSPNFRMTTDSDAKYDQQTMNTCFPLSLCGSSYTTQMKVPDRK